MTRPVLVGHKRTCRACGVPKYRSAFRQHRACCRDCEQAKSRAEKRLAAAENRALGLTAKGAPRKGAAPPLAMRRGRRVVSDPFATLTAWLESLWGVPYAKWSTRLHWCQTNVLRARIGAAPLPPMIDDDTRRVAA